MFQPAPETSDLFDNIIVLFSGLVVYQGPHKLVFEFMSFKCSVKKGVTDFFQDVISRKDLQQRWTQWKFDPTIDDKCKTLYGLSSYMKASFIYSNMTHFIRLQFFGCFTWCDILSTIVFWEILLLEINQRRTKEVWKRDVCLRLEDGAHTYRQCSLTS